MIARPPARPSSMGHPVSVRQRAATLGAVGWSYAEISRILASEGHSVSAQTIGTWLDEEKGARVRARRRAYYRRTAGEAARFRLNGSTPQYRCAFVKHLVASGLDADDTAVVATIVFGLPFLHADVLTILDDRIPDCLHAADNGSHDGGAHR